MVEEEAQHRTGRWLTVLSLTISEIIQLNG
jgi:hypothetical protein